MALPSWINYVFAGISMTITGILIETLYYLRKPKFVLCLIPNRIKRDTLIPIIGSFFFIAAGILKLINSLTGMELFYDIMVFFLDFFLITMINFVYSLRKDIGLVSE